MITLSAEDVRRLVPMQDAVGAVRDAFVSVAEGTVDQPQRLVSADGLALSMMARDRATLDTTVKTVSIVPGNRAVGLPTIQAVVLLFDGVTGSPVLLADGAAVTALRTGAASGVATDLLAREDARVLAIVGAGAQARDQVDAVCAVRPIEEIRVVSRGGTSAAALAEALRSDGVAPAVIAVADVRGALDGADVVCCATPATEPLFALADLGPDVHVNAIGAYTPAMCELGADVVGAASVVAVDEVHAALEEAGDLLRAIDAGTLATADLREIGRIARDGLPAPRIGLTVFKSVGVAVQDLAIARLARERAAG